MLAALGYGFEVLFHDVDGVVDLLLIADGVSDSTEPKVRRVHGLVVGSSIIGGEAATSGVPVQF